MKNYQNTIESEVPIEELKGFVDPAFITSLEEANIHCIPVWGMVKIGAGIRNEWRELSSDDYAVFYGKKRFFYMAKVIGKIHNPKLAESLWGSDEEGRTWEFIYFLSDGKQISIPYDPKIVNYKVRHVFQKAILLNEERTRNLIKVIQQNEGTIFDEAKIEPSKEQISKISSFAKETNDPQEAAAIINMFSVSLLIEPVRERIRYAKSLARNPKFARLVKERSNFTCEICGEKGFEKKDGLLYSEAHHLFEIAQTKIDNPHKMICVCPTCHRVIHYGNDNALEERKSLKGH